MVEAKKSSSVKVKGFDVLSTWKVRKVCRDSGWFFEGFDGFGSSSVHLYFIFYWNCNWSCFRNKIAYICKGLFILISHWNAGSYSNRFFDSFPFYFVYEHTVCRNWKVWNFLELSLILKRFMGFFSSAFLVYFWKRKKYKEYARSKCYINRRG